MMKNVLAASLLVLGAAVATAGAAHATVYQGGGTFTDTGNLSNGGGISFDTSTQSFGPTSLISGGSLTFFVNVSGTVNGSCSFFNQCTDSVNMDVSFTLPGSGSVNQSGDGTDFKFFGSVANGSVTWGSGNYAEDIVSFQDGAKASVDIYNAGLSGTGGNKFGGSVEVVINDLQDPTAVPEPVSLALLGTGLLGVGMIRRRRRAA